MINLSPMDTKYKFILWIISDESVSQSADMELPLCIDITEFSRAIRNVLLKTNYQYDIIDAAIVFKNYI